MYGAKSNGLCPRVKAIIVLGGCRESSACDKKGGFEARPASESSEGPLKPWMHKHGRLSCPEGLPGDGICR